MATEKKKGVSMVAGILIFLAFAAIGFLLFMAVWNMVPFIRHDILSLLGMLD